MEKNGLPKYMQLKGQLLERIKEGQMQPGDQLPTEFELSDSYKMSRQTVRQAIGELVQEGWLYRVQGKGTFVAASAAPAKKAEETEKTIGIITTYISDYIFPLIVRGAEAELRSRGYRLMLSSTDNDKAKERESLELMMSHPLSGLIIEPTKSAEGNPNLHYYLSMGMSDIPFIMINERYPEMDCPCVKLDDEKGGFLAAEHLIELGHRRIVGFFKTDDLQGIQRLKGFIRAHRDYKVPLDPDSVVRYSTEDKEERPFEAAQVLLASSERPTAFVCYNDQLAVHLLETARQAGLRVPQDLSIIGFDDSSLATATEVKLTTLTHPKTEMGVEAARRLIDRIEGISAGGAEEEAYVYEPQLVIRSSTGPV
ncbi:GntR family transcriptional regulator [Paenibacillus mucilaginosus]|uniref:AraR n=3 Tax=Paenibacillus mucilaginosus TaxID=61624 RepID=H6NH31_9BACL|nr:GntR family transcriptional regulator [Paenibacillus mucilaginosus]AEI40056.1 AraR [Paenibacillus mucilaginosus KNP414]AFC28709.1 AraR [Paenibacillus mucilaginosus 3016]AFH60886.1 GntR family transcriptional regulator [Paenibacillus mucilaginosus K02]MCG7215663.1 GntR family transcriptional regulator [Paenibacillus mucilaginosus]WDM29296.1 GntR family transcriptional regulator [Paenibacillus mucilaginosus]